MESSLIEVSNPWQGAEGVTMQYFIARNNEKPPRDFAGQTIKAGAQRIVCMSSSYIAMLDIIGESNRIVGVSGFDYITNPALQARRGEVKDLGADINYELLIGLNPDVVLLYGINNEQQLVTDKLEELSIPYVYISEYLEESPLGKAEWLVVLSELVDRREKGIETFQGVSGRYESLKTLVDSVEQRPSVMLNAPWNDSWFMPSTQNYSVQLISDAGGDYIYKENQSNRSVPIGMETAYQLLQHADYWLNMGAITTLDELIAINSNFIKAKAVCNHTVYNNNLRNTQSGGNDYWESGTVHPDIILRDLISILHPEILSKPLYYYRHLE